MNSTFKRIAARLPDRWQQTLKRSYFARQICSDSFRTDESEYALLDRLVAAGDWAIDIGANVGHYTFRLSQLVGSTGRVIAFEPVPATFELLASNATNFPFQNVTLVNAAASDSTRVVGMSVPKLASGLRNFYMARLDDGDSDVTVLAFAVDNLQLSHKVSLVKIDAEGHELSVLRGIEDLLARDGPHLIVEDSSPEVWQFVRHFGYTQSKLSGSHNVVFSRNLVF